MSYNNDSEIIREATEAFNQNLGAGSYVGELLGIINSQKTQLLKEQNKNSKLRNKRNRLNAKLKEIKVSAYKECIEKVLEKRWDVPYETKDAHYVQVVDVGDIEDTLKELVGELYAENPR